MTRKKAVSLVLVIVLALAVLVAPMVATAAGFGTALHFDQAGINPISVGVSHALSAGMACEGCTGGGGGPG